MATPRMPIFNDQQQQLLKPDPAQRSNSNSQTSTPRRSVTPPPAPTATTTYLTQSSSPPTLTTTTQPLLIILDLNGTLIHRIGRRPIRFKTRPGLHAFIKELVEKYTVMVWTSSRPPTVREVLEKTFTAEEREKFVAVWGRDTLGLTAKQYSEKVQVYKRLDKVWGDKGIGKFYPGIVENGSNNHDDDDGGGDATAGDRRGGVGKKKKNKKQKARDAVPSDNTPWNQTNTLLIDDSALKALAQPYNIIEIPEFANVNPPAHEEKVLDTVLRQLRVLSRYTDVSCKVREWEELRRGLQRQRKDGKGNLPQSHSKADIEGFWDVQLARDEEAIRRVDGGDSLRADADEETDILVSRQAASRYRTQPEAQHPPSFSTANQTPTLNRNEEAKTEKTHMKKQKKSARFDATTVTDAITLTGEGSGDRDRDGDREADGGVVLGVN